MNAFANLSEEQREWVRGKSWSQIGREKGVSNGAVWLRNHAYQAPPDRQGKQDRPRTLGLHLDATSLLQAKLAEERQLIRLYSRLLACHREVLQACETELERRRARDGDDG